MVSADDMDKFEQKEMKKIRPIKNTWYNRLINYIPEPKRKNLGGFKDKILSLFICIYICIYIYIYIYINIYIKEMK